MLDANGVAYDVREDIPRVPVITVPRNGYTLVIDPDDDDDPWTWLAVAWDDDLSGPVVCRPGTVELVHAAHGVDQLAGLVWWIVTVAR
jgi:hypothetical protein